VTKKVSSPGRSAKADCDAVERRVEELLEAIPYVTDNRDLLARRRAQIAAAAFEEFALVGFRSTSVSSVARRAGMDKRTMYDYVGDKHDVLYLVFLTFLPRQIQHIAATLSDDDEPMVQLEKMAHAHLEYLAEKSSLAFMYYREMRYLHREQIDEVLWVIGQVISLYEGAVRRGVAAGTMVSDEPHVAARLVAAACDMPTLAAWDLGAYDPSVVEHEILRLTLNGLRAR
jgi:AcrR family transcriptional regulator